MGSCVSLHKGSEAAMKLDLSVDAKGEKLLIPSPVKEKSDTVNGGDRTIGDVALKSHWSPPRFREAGSKEESFFDSQPWLESDCEDDYYSVNGDFTPSRGSTPVHHSFSLGKLQVINKAPPPAVEETLTPVPEPSPPDKKKRLSELFKESLRSDLDFDEENKNEIPSKTEEAEAKSRNGTPSHLLPRALSGVSSEKTPTNGVFKSEVKSWKKSPQCCLPRLRSSRSYSERKSRIMSPAHSVG